ncbi:TRAP transporter small permease subunit [Marispirochaeta sp.]|uniref:TRAP transporter small permease subunit n=1 Tax=Marispirochaeta sp. TaxID=2038653 RepID=UPI0029C89BB1|nr:TRAP transporter small permease subunit [Marispirochaeta sp.]
MNRAVEKYIRTVDGISRTVGKLAMVIVLFLIGILLYESVSRTFFNKPNIWSIELSQFVMAAYYMLGGAYTLILDGHVRMDLLYHRWSPKKKAIMDIITFVVVLVYLGVLLHGSCKGTLYAIEYHQVSYSAWKPSLIPIKVIMTFGISLLFLQTTSELLKDIALVRGKDISHLRSEG